MVPSDDAAATATALSRALGRSVAERSAIGLRGRAVVRDRADQAASLGNVERLYLKLRRESAGRTL